MTAWRLSWRADPAAKVLADRHYNRQNPDAAQFVPPGRCLVLLAGDPPSALWITSWPLPKYVQHEWPGAWVCSAFRREGGPIASELIIEAVAATRWKWPAVPDLGMVTFIDPAEVRPKRDPGYCFLAAGFEPAGRTHRRDLIALRLPPDRMPNPLEPHPRTGALLAV